MAFYEQSRGILSEKFYQFKKNFISSCIRKWITETRGAPISKLTGIPITDILAMKNTDTDANTDIAAPFNYAKFLYFHHIYGHLLVVHYIYMFDAHPIHGFSVWHTGIVKLCIVLNGVDRP